MTRPTYPMCTDTHLPIYSFVEKEAGLNLTYPVDSKHLSQTAILPNTQ